MLGTVGDWGLAGCAGEPAEMAVADRERAARRLHARETGGGRLGWPERRRAVIAATVFAKGFGKPTCCQISAPIIFFQNKRRYFCTVNLHLSSLPPPLSLPHAHVFGAFRDFSCAGSEKRPPPTSSPQAQGKRDAL